jgi:ABC-type lipoprotein export system ATPase subunit/Fe2+ transport system protein FeoA
MMHWESVPEGSGTQVVTIGTSQVRSIQITGGFLDGLQFDLDRGLNCLIGARGTGKTTILELVRYALDALPANESPERHRIENLVKANLGNGTIELTIETRDGVVYTITRSWQDNPIVQDSNGQAADIALRAGRVFRADIYSQNEIERIAEQSMSQLSLIDNFESDELAKITQHSRTLVSQLETNAMALKPLQDQIDGLNSEIAGLPGIQEKLKAMGPITGQNAEVVTKAQQAKFLRERETAAVNEIGEFVYEYGKQIKLQQGRVLQQINQSLQQDLLNSPNGVLLKNAHQSLLASASEIDALLQKVCDKLTAMDQVLCQSHSTLKQTHGQQEIAYQNILKENEDLRNQANERNRLSRMSGDLIRKQNQRNLLIQNQATLQAERAEMLNELSELRDQRFNLRNQIAQRINSSLNPDIRVTIEQAGNHDQYRSMLSDALQGVRITRNVVAQRIADRILPTELVEIVRRNDATSLIEQAGLSEEQSRKVVDALCDSDELFALETVELSDLPRIELKDGEQYKDSASLSTGQKCTTVLPILLLESDSPLLIDQPEDNLDNRFVCESVVNSIHTVKAKRQLIFVTHNPNIPVLADAERVFVLESDGKQSGKSIEGTVDECREEIVNLLEGGEQAFKKRQERYAY